MHSDRKFKIESKIISGLAIIHEAFTENIKAEIGMNKKVRMSKFIPQSKSARYFRGPALCRGLEHLMKLVDGMVIDAENMSSVNPRRSVHCETWYKTGQFSRTRYVTEKEDAGPTYYLRFSSSFSSEDEPAISHSRLL